MDRRFVEASELQRGVETRLLAFVPRERRLVAHEKALPDGSPPRRIGDFDEAPRLTVSHRRCIRRDTNEVLNQRRVEGIRHKPTNVAAPADKLFEPLPEAVIE